MAEKSKTPWVVLLLVGCFVILLCCCCSVGLLVAAGSQGSLPDELQDEYDSQDLFDEWDEDDFLYDSSTTENGDDESSSYESATDDSASDDSPASDDAAAYTDEDCDFPNGDIEYWWYEVDEEMRECYRDTYGDPWFLDE